MRKTDRKVAYFSMEIAASPEMPTYSGGLGVLAGDIIRSFADLNVPAVAVTLLYKKGHFKQLLDKYGQQMEMIDAWDPAKYLKLLKKKITVRIENRAIYVRAWEFKVKGAGRYSLPIIFLDTDIENNSDYDRKLTHHLYGGDDYYRLVQEIILGIGGVRMLKKLGYSGINQYHMNEGHSSLLTLELLDKKRDGQTSEYNIEEVKKMCVFTTHTPVPAGHDQFSYGLVSHVLGEFFPIDFLKKLGGEDKLNMTLLALNLSHYINGVAKKHGQVSREMFPRYTIDSITNGIHSVTWIGNSFKELFDRYIPGWTIDPFSLRHILRSSIPDEEIWKTHQEAKRVLIDYTNKNTGTGMDYNTITIGFARRSTAYKRADLIFCDKERLIKIVREKGPIQLIFSGKAHPKDGEGKELIKKIFSAADGLADKIKIAYLTNYDMKLGKMLTSGVDVWLNTPQKPKEASGTSGMKAAHNGVPSLSILDGWWIEGCIEGLTGWGIGTDQNTASDRENDACDLYDKLENEVVPMYYHDRPRWINIMRHAIGINAPHFNTHRVVQQYVLRAYLY